MKVIFVTGASSGIGKAIGDFLADRGYQVFGSSRNPEQYPASNFPLVQLDVRKSDEIVSAVSEVISKAGRIDVLINNAGVGITGPVEEIPLEEMRNNFETNFFGPIEMMKAVLPQMRSQGEGLIINITSIAGYMGLPYRGVYSASKGALEILSEAVRMEVRKQKIRVTTVAPGDYATNIAAGRYHSPLTETSVYRHDYGATLEAMNSHVNSGGDPIEIAHCIDMIIRDTNPKVHYRVGAFMQKASVILKRLLPSGVYEKMLRNHYKL